MPSISRTPSIYQIRHIASGKVYVGSAVNPRTRWGIHCTVLNQGTHHSRHLQNAWNKHGKDAFVFEILEPVLFVEDLLTREQYWIDTLHASERAHGYNATPTAGSVLGIKRSVEYRAKLSERMKAQFADPLERAKHSERQKVSHADPAYRVRVSERTKAQFTDPEQRAKTAEQARAYYADPAQRAKLSERAKARFADPLERAKASERATTQFADPEQRAKASERAKARSASPETRAEMSERTKALWRDPEYRARQKTIRDARKKERP